MLTAVLSGFALAILAPWLTGLFKDRIGWLLALLPLGLTAYFISHVPAVSNGQVVLQSWDWLPGLGINLSFMLDGLSLQIGRASCRERVLVWVRRAGQRGEPC